MAGAAPFAIALAAYLIAIGALRSAPNGDEPHYLIVGYSLVNDGDLDLANQYRPETQPDTGTGLLGTERHTTDPLRDGKLRPSHPIGTGILIGPALWIGAGPLGARVSLALIGALMADQLMRLLRENTSLPAGWRWAAWAASALTLPVLTYSTQIFPEIVSALLAVVALRSILDSARHGRVPWPALVCIAVSPWFHQRFIPLMGGMLMLAVLGMVAPRHLVTPSAGTRPVGWTTAMGLATLAILGGLSWFVFQVWLFGTTRLDAPYANFRSGFPLDRLFNLVTAYNSMLSSLFNANYGWLPYSPVHVLGILGLAVIAARRTLAVGLVALSIAAFLWLISMPPAGPSQSAQGRYAVAMAALLALPIAAVLGRSSRWQIAFVVLGLYSATCAIWVLFMPRAIRPDPLGRATLPPVELVESIWPTRPRGITTLSAEGDGLTIFTGSVLADGRAYGRPEDAPGILATTPARPLIEGEFVARFMLAADGPRGEELGRLEVVQDGIVIANRPIIRDDFPVRGREVTIVVPVVVGESLETAARVVHGGRGQLWVRRIEMVSRGGQGRLDQFRDIPKAVAWFVGLGLACVLTYVIASRSERIRPSS
jgi:hypothetical protein